MPKSSETMLRQSGVIPFRYNGGGEPEILLITTVRRKYWVIPKGIVEDALSPAESALKEAWEEAGISGEISSRPFGTYDYEKWGGICTVAVFLLEVHQEDEDWPERKLRDRRWMSFRKAAKLVRQEELADMIRRAAESLEPD